jgi:hypothetical protein
VGQRLGCGKVALRESGEERPKYLDVLPRHRPRSIPEARHAGANEDDDADGPGDAAFSRGRLGGEDRRGAP